ncbi:hypothetical protein [Paraburkholderia caballeronis]|nr:hypothetical protein [Paraburkholderia caballeronis]
MTVRHRLIGQYLDQRLDGIAGAAPGFPDARALVTAAIDRVQRVEDS